MSFKLGDRVKVNIDISARGGTVSRGTAGTVVRVDEHFIADTDYTVEFDSGELEVLKERDLFQSGAQAR